MDGPGTGGPSPCSLPESLRESLSLGITLGCFPFRGARLVVAALRALAVRSTPGTAGTVGLDFAEGREVRPEERLEVEALRAVPEDFWAAIVPMGGGVDRSVG